MKIIDWAREVKAMADKKKELYEDIKSFHENIIKWWCLCDYFSKYGDTNELLHHESVKLRNDIGKIREWKCKGTNTEKTKRKILEDILIRRYEYDKSPRLVVHIFASKFDKEKIEYNEERFMDIAKDFGKDVKKLIDLMSIEPPQNINKYVSERFNVK